MKRKRQTRVSRVWIFGCLQYRNHNYNGRKYNDMPEGDRRSVIDYPVIPGSFRSLVILHWEFSTRNYRRGSAGITFRSVGFEIVSSFVFSNNSSESSIYYSVWKSQKKTIFWFDELAINSEVNVWIESNCLVELIKRPPKKSSVNTQHDDYNSRNEVRSSIFSHFVPWLRRRNFIIFESSAVHSFVYDFTMIESRICFAFQFTMFAIWNETMWFTSVLQISYQFYTNFY